MLWVQKETGLKKLVQTICSHHLMQAGGGWADLAAGSDPYLVHTWPEFQCCLEKPFGRLFEIGVEDVFMAFEATATSSSTGNISSAQISASFPRCRTARAARGLERWLVAALRQEYQPQSAYLKWQVVDEQKAFGCPPNRGTSRLSAPTLVAAGKVFCVTGLQKELFEAY